MGNGYPVAAFGGRADVMECINLNAEGVVHGGTYTANLVAVSAALATLNVLDTTDALETVSKTGARIKQRLSSVFNKFNLDHVFAGPDSMFGVHFLSSVPQNYRDWRRGDNELYQRFAFNLIENGIMLEPDSREPWFICEAHQNLDLDWFERVAYDAMSRAI